MSKSPSPELEPIRRQTTRVATDPSSGVTRVPDSTGPYLPGEVIDDRFRLERELGRGGMGVVWVARSLVLGVDVALKLIRTAETGADAASRMAREANAAARVAHPALVRVFDFGWTRHGDPFLVMELIQGEPLSDTLQREQTLSAIRTVQILLPIADGLRLAHARSIVHRDIKPANIIIAEEGTKRPQPKLLDFGIAKVGHGGDGKLTQQGTVLGSPEYMSPEQALGLDQVDERSDVWSLGIVIYELITGAVPYSRANYNALMQAIIHEEPEPMTLRGGADDALWSLVSRALAKHPKERWQSMSEFGSALALWLYDHGIKEDISGNSLRAVWLDEGLEATPVARPSSLPPSLQQALASLGRKPPRLDMTRPASVPPPELLPEDEDAAPFLARPAWRRNPKLLAASGIGLLTVIVLVVWGARSSDPEGDAHEAAPAPSSELGPGQGQAAGDTSDPARSAVDPKDLPRLPDAPDPTPAVNADGRKKPNKSNATKPKANRDFGF